MARTKSPTLTDAELRLMDIVWQKGQASAADVLAAMPDAELAYTTVLNTLRILEAKGYLRHTKQGKAFIYHPLVDRKEASTSAVKHLVSRFFGNSPSLLVSSLIRDEQLGKRELDRLKKLIEESE
ncbi:MAG TPA: BlaI/MecI/CopY family transcriptional regulator [Bryobacteraceae bacterium]|nr:BlaI/MecI/CopY family transcriptional regulator [Bryobacteraceae bacterium]